MCAVVCCLARAVGFEPTSTVLETAILPLYYARKKLLLCQLPGIRLAYGPANWFGQQCCGACTADVLQYFGYLTGTDGTATFADSETQTFFHRYFVDQLYVDGHVFTWHYHLYAWLQ